MQHLNFLAYHELGTKLKEEEAAEKREEKAAKMNEKLQKDAGRQKPRKQKAEES